MRVAIHLGLLLAGCHHGPAHRDGPYALGVPATYAVLADGDEAVVVDGIQAWECGVAAPSRVSKSAPTSDDDWLQTAVEDACRRRAGGASPKISATTDRLATTAFVQVRFATTSPLKDNNDERCRIELDGLDVGRGSCEGMVRVTSGLHQLRLIDREHNHSDGAVFDAKPGRRYSFRLMFEPGRT